MASMRQVVMPGKLGRTVRAVTSVRDQEVEKCHLASSDPPSSSPAMKETVETAENSEEDNDDYPESVASECSVESNAESNAPDGECGDCDVDSPSYEEKSIKRCPSGGSIVTYDEAASKLREEGECERTGDRKVSRRSERSLSNEFQDDEQENSINASQRMAESTGPAWTDDKHCSYLNSIEQTFVQSLFGQDYHTVDASGQDDQDCVESRPMFGNPYGSEFFTSLQRGCYDQREYYRPQVLSSLGPSTSAVFLSPWIQHFNPRVATTSHGSAGQDPETGNPSTGVVDGAYGGNFGNGDVKEEVKESIPNLNNPETGSQAPLFWSSRYQSQHNASTSAHVRADTGIQTKKRNCNPDPGSDATYRPKKLKSTQRWLAEIDLEMEEEFLEKQKLKELAEFSDVKDEPQSLGGMSGGLDLNQELVDEETKAEDSPETLARPVTETADLISSFKEPTATSHIECVREVGMGKKPYQPKSHQATFLSQRPEGDFGEGTSDVNKVVDARGCNAPAGILQKPRQDEDYSSYRADSGFDEEEEFEFLLRRSPLASKTYTWGAVGPRRRLHNEWDVLVEAAAHSGSVKDSRDHELANKGKTEEK